MTDERAKEVVVVLRARAACMSTTSVEAGAMRDAADELERLREALKPFAGIWHELRETGVASAPKTGDFKRAAEVLK